MVCSILIYSCNSIKDGGLNNDKYIDSAFDDIKNIDIELVSGVSAEWRGYEVLLFRYCLQGDSTELGIPFLIKKTKDNILICKLQDNWIPVDSISNYIKEDTSNLYSEKMNYCYTIMERLEIKKISNFNNSYFLIIEKETLEFYYALDDAYTKEKTFIEETIKLEGNWWVKKLD